MKSLIANKILKNILHRNSGGVISITIQNKSIYYIFEDGFYANVKNVSLSDIYAGVEKFQLHFFLLPRHLDCTCIGPNGSLRGPFRQREKQLHC